MPDNPETPPIHEYQSGERIDEVPDSVIDLGEQLRSLRLSGKRQEEVGSWLNEYVASKVSAVRATATPAELGFYEPDDMLMNIEKALRSALDSLVEAHFIGTASSSDSEGDFHAYRYQTPEGEVNLKIRTKAGETRALASLEMFQPESDQQ